MREFYPDSSFVRVIARGSGELTPADLGSGCTFSHIDGGHSPEEVYHDLKLCYDVSVDGGLIALDDYFNPEHPGVCEGAVEFSLRHPGWLRPLVAGYNKVLFQKARGASTDLSSSFLKTFPNLKYKTVRMWKSPVILLGASLREQIDLYASTPENFVRIGSARARFKPAIKTIRARPGENIDIEVEVQNVSSETFPAGEGIFGLSYHLLEHDNPRAWLSRSLAPKEKCVVRLAVTAPLKPGKYEIEIDLVWEGVMWFKDVGNPTAMIELSVV
jgi:hypothetical protein